MTFQPGQVITEALLNTGDMVGKVVFQSVRATAQAIPTTVATAISWDTPTIDTMGVYSGGTPTRFTPNVAGNYLLMGKVGFASNASTTFRYVSWLKNGATTPSGRAGFTVAWAAAPVGINAHTVSISMNGTTDYIELAALQNIGSNLNTATLEDQPGINIVYVGA